MLETYPLIAIKDTVIFPYSRIPIFVGREISQRALLAALERDKKIFFVTQKNPQIEIPKESDLYTVGCIGSIIQSIKEPYDGYKILAEGLVRAKIKQFYMESYYQAEVIPEPVKYISNQKTDAIFSVLIEEFKKFAEVAANIPKEILEDIISLSDPIKVIYLVATYLPVNVKKKQKLLEESNIEKLIMSLIQEIAREREYLLVKKDITEKVHKTIQKNQREYFLSEEMKAIERELGKGSENKEYNQYYQKIKKAKMPKAVEKMALDELQRLTKMMPYSPEATVVRTYLDWLVAMPWQIKTEDKLNIREVKKILEEDHWGLKKPKERILEYLAVCKLNKKIKGPILCFVGPPGTGKTSFAKSIARAIGRNFVRISMGGVRDEAEIRGHRRTYIGAMPGKIIQSIKKAGSKNPIFLIDEIDKIGADFRGDPAAALLEVLDPEQNNSFQDHYLDVPFDLSDVMFITTANTTYSIIPALKDRMEIIEFPSYTENEKVKIAKNFLIPKQIKENGLEKFKINFTEDGILKIIRSYTQEAGVRNLEREIANVLRKIARDVVEKTKNNKKITVDEKTVRKYLGYEKIIRDEGKANDTGVACGLAWTEVGGEVILVESVLMKGKGNIILTGHLGNVMKESAQAAVSYIRSCAKEYKIPEYFIKDKDIHIHVPEGAIPKDGPSAGITIVVSLLSAILNKPVKKDIAMTGEITLSGRILPVGGIKEKILAAVREKIKKVFIPDKNKGELEEIKEILPDLLKKIKVVPVKKIDEVVKEAIQWKEERNL